MRTHRTILSAAISILLAALLVSCGDDDDPADPGDGTFNGTIRVVDNSFSPANVTISVGDSVTWSWQGNNSHTVTHGTAPGTPPVPLFDEGPKTSGTFGYRFTANEGTPPYTIAYYCQPHFAMGMKGTITVQP